jgi:hypothetical protein
VDDAHAQVLLKPFRKKEDIPMSKKLFMLGLTILVFCCMAWAAEKSITGVVSDSHCGAKHSAASDEAAACIGKCVSNGAQYVLVSNGKVYKVSPQDSFKDYAGKGVTVTGTVSKGTITASKVEASQ